MIALQTSCSKEKTQNAENFRKGPAPTFSQNHEEVLNFTSEFQKWQNEESYSYYDLNAADAEWILEAALNYDNQFAPDDYDNYALLVYAEDTAEIEVEVNESGKVSTAELFSIYSQLQYEAAQVTDLAPASNIEIVDENGEYLILGQFVREELNAPLSEFSNPLPIEQEAYYSIYYTGPNKFPYLPICSMAPMAPNGILVRLIDHNMKAIHGPILLRAGYYTNQKTNVYPEDANLHSDYIGNVTATDYSLDILGATPNANSNTISNGNTYQCIDEYTTGNATHFHDGIDALMTDEVISGHEITVVDGVSSSWSADFVQSPGQYTSEDPSGLWLYHQVKFTTGKWLP